MDDYVPGHVLVTFKDTPEPCEQNIAKMLGYEFLGFMYDVVPATSGCDAVYRVPVGEEDDAIRRFQEQEVLVEGAYRRIKSFERICHYQEEIEPVLEDIYSEVQKPEDVMIALRGLEKAVLSCIADEENVMREESEEE